MLPAGTTATVSYTMVLDLPLPAGTQVVNQALLDALFGYGNRVSDDPTTPATDDPTVLISDSLTDRDGDGVPQP